MQMNEAIGRRLAELMREKQTTQRELSERSGVARSTIGGLLRCSHITVRVSTLFRLCKGLGIAPSAFFRSTLFDREHLD